MPIKGLTDRASLRPQLARLGKLRKGAEKTDPKRPGKDLDHFRPDFSSPEVQQAFEDAYGKQPKMINIALFYKTLEECFSTWIEAWDASGMVFRSDGEFWHVWREGDTYKRGRKPHQDHPDQRNKGRLEFIIPELVNQGYRGSVTLETSSINDLLNISNTLAMIERHSGTLENANLILYREKETISTPGWGDRKGQRSQTEKWLVKIRLPRRVFDAILEGTIEDRPALEAGDVDVTTGEIVEELPAPTQKAKPTKSTQTQIGRPKAEKAKFTREEIEGRWEELWSEARALSLDPDTLPKTTPQMTNEELIEAGKALAAIVKNARISAAE